MAKSSPTRKSRVFTISFPEDLAQQVEALAKQESRTISEMFREAFRTLKVNRRDAMLDRFRAEAEKRGPIPYGPEDVESLVDEIRRDNAERSRRKKTA